VRHVRPVALAAQERRRQEVGDLQVLGLLDGRPVVVLHRKSIPDPVQHVLDIESRPDVRREVRTPPPVLVGEDRVGPLVQPLLVESALDSAPELSLRRKCLLEHAGPDGGVRVLAP
jgi:hypothetical protein